MSVEKFQQSVEDIKKDKTSIINQAGHDLNRWMADVRIEKGRLQKIIIMRALLDMH